MPNKFMGVRKDLNVLLEEIRQDCEQGDRHGLSEKLRLLMQHRKAYYHESCQLHLEDELSDSLFKVLLLELDEEEAESIETAELAYLGIASVLKDDSPGITPEHYKRRLLLLHYFSDYFTDAIIEIFLKKYRENNLLEARNMALECIEKMQMADILQLEKTYPEFIDADEQLTDACNSLQFPPDFSEEAQQEADLLHKVLYAYLKAKHRA
ncbi:hypothetical protein [Odoribacter lunatus]|uniref:hypothetical protein n=1 Tax=Odoribacter lunatus TaxID=2941335 RepID=UPI00203EF359|nr:hypothetical protein [Odoribacter lunatus]